MNVRYAIVRIADLDGFIRRNPHAIGPEVGPFGWKVRLNMQKANKPVFRKALKESIQKEGMRNPILGWCFKEGLFYAFGAGRVQAAKEAGLTEVPMIVNDFTGEYKSSERVTPENFAEFFKDVPLTYEFNKQGFTYHYNLTPSTREIHDPGGVDWYEGEISDFYEEFPYLRQVVDSP